MLVYKLQGDFSGPFVVLMRLFLIMLSGIKCLYTSFRAILVDHVLCSYNCF
jgi:hypothetical protein